MPRVTKFDRPSRLRMLARRQRRLLRPLLLAVPLIGLVGIGALAVRGAVDRAGTGSWIRHRLGLALPITAIEVQGAHLTSREDVTEALGVAPGEPIMAVSIAELERNVETLPFIETAIVQRRLPGTLLVSITERSPFAVWQNQGRFVLIDRTGKVVENQGFAGKDAEAFAKLPLVVGEGAPAAAGALIAALDAEPSVRSHVAAMVRVGERRWNLALRNGCDVLLPEAEEVPAITRLASLDKQYALLERPLQVIDMRLPDRLVLRPPPPPPTAAEPARPAGKDAGKDPA